MAITRRRFVFTSLGSAFVAPHLFSMTPSPDGAPGSVPSPAPVEPSGSGHFGEWIDDEFALPAFRYTCNQIADPAAITPVNPGLLSPTEHIHQVGNDRITAIASNYGYVRVRQDEGSPKFLTDFDPSTHQFAGGIGWLTDGTEHLSTLYSGQPEFERIFGVGYFRKRVSGRRFAVDQVIFAPFGDDPVLLSQVTLANHGTAPANLRWIEYWGVQSYEFSFRDFIVSWTGMATAPELRRRAGERSTHRISRIEGGLLETRHFPGHTPEESAAWQRMKQQLQSHPNGFIAPVPDPKPGTWFESNDPPATFLVALDAGPSGFSTDAASFFGSSGPTHPAGLAHPLRGDLSSTGPQTGLLLERTLKLQPGEQRTLSFLYGYLPPGFDSGTLIAHYKSESASALKASSAQWKRHGMKFHVEGEPWVQRETTWNHYCLRSSLTCDNFFQQRILNQNGFYQYVIGFQGAARDPLQHALPFLFSDPAIVRSVLRYTLSEVRPDGSLPYAITGHGVVAPMVADNASDLPLWLLWAVSEYILATRDLDFLHEQIPARVAGSGTDSVLNLLARCYRHQVTSVGVGRHGIVRMLNDDWNDGLLGTWAQSDFAEAAADGESVLNSAMSAWVFDQYARMLRYANADPPLRHELQTTAESCRTAARSQWTGRWLRRAWLGPKLGWLGESTLWLEPQPWAILAGITSAEQTQTLVSAINDLLRQGPLGATQMSNGPDLYKQGLFEPGTVVRGGIWPSLNQTLVWALAGINPRMAWDEWKRNSLAAHAEAYPNIWYGIWSGPDSWNSPLSKTPGQTAQSSAFHGVDFPVLNLHSHACFLYSATKLLGIDFTEDGLTIQPTLPSQSYRFESPLVGVVRSAHGHLQGWYAPSRAGQWTIRIRVPAHEAHNLTHAEVNGASAPLALRDGAFQLTGSSEPGRPLHWALH